MSTDTPTGTYAAFRLTKEAEGKLHAFVASILPDSLPLEDPEEYHITTTYSRQVIKYEPGPQQDVAVVATSYEYFGRPDSQPVLVLRVEHPLLHNCHNNALALGATHDFPDYLPHITLTKKLVARSVDLKNLPLPSWNIELAAEYTNDLRKEDFEQEGELL